jgi:hypothetical protein
MPWVPGRSAGQAGGDSGTAGICKYMQTSSDLMLELRPRCWAHLGGISGGENI